MLAATQTRIRIAAANQARIDNEGEFRKAKPMSDSKNAMLLSPCSLPVVSVDAALLNLTNTEAKIRRGAAPPGPPALL